MAVSIFPSWTGGGLKPTRQRLDGRWATARNTTSLDGMRAEAEALYSLLEREVVPTFYARDARGIPPGWVAKMRASMAQLTTRFSSNRMVREYTENYYIPAARELERRMAPNGQVGIAIEQWRRRLAERWGTLHFGNLSVSRSDSSLTFELQVYLGEIEPADVR